MSYPSLVATDPKDFNTYPKDFRVVHEQGVPHRAVHIEILNSLRKYFIWQREDDRFEIPGGHVDWIEDQNRPETYEEAALREINEELNCSANWELDLEAVFTRLKGCLVPLERIVNQIPSSHGSNNEWVMVYRLYWQDEWGDLCSRKWNLSKEGKTPRWLSLDEIEQLCLEKPMNINAALRLFLRRRDTLIPMIKHATV